MTIALDRMAWPVPAALRPARRSGCPRCVELLAVVLLYAAYSAARTLVPADVDAARANGDGLLAFERLLHLDVEAAANDWLTAHATVALVASYWYAALHYTVTPALLLLLRGRAPGRPTGGCATASWPPRCSRWSGYAAFPAMPPRLLGGYTDTLAQTSGQGWWGAEASAPRGLGGLTNQFAAMPSMHVGWAVWCALAAAALLVGSRCGGSSGCTRWARSSWSSRPPTTGSSTVSRVRPSSSGCASDCGGDQAARRAPHRLARDGRHAAGRPGRRRRRGDRGGRGRDPGGAGGHGIRRAGGRRPAARDAGQHGLHGRRPEGLLRRAATTRACARRRACPTACGCTATTTSPAPSARSSRSPPGCAGSPSYRPSPSWVPCRPRTASGCVSSAASWPPRSWA